MKSGRSSSTSSFLNTAKPGILIDIGRGYTKAGLSGNVLPRVCFKSEVRINNGAAARVLSLEEVNKEPLGVQRVLISRFLKEVFLSHLKVNSRSEKVFIILNLFAHEVMRIIIEDLLVNKFKVKAVFFLVDSICSLIPHITETAIVINLGYEDALVTPIYAKVPIVFASVSVNVGAVHLCSVLKDALGDHFGSKIEPMNLDDSKLLNLLFKYGDALSSHDVQGMIPSSPTDVMQYKSIPVKCCYDAINHYFDESGDLNIVEAVENCLNECPIDSRKELASNVIFTGGFSDIRNIKKRILQELSVSNKQNLQFGTRKVNLPGSYVPWTGASLEVHSVLEHSRESMICDDVALGSFVSSVWPNFSR